MYGFYVKQILIVDFNLIKCRMKIKILSIHPSIHPFIHSFLDSSLVPNVTFF